jgi:hypothetical protein
VFYCVNWMLCSGGCAGLRAQRHHRGCVADAVEPRGR